jgi:hypothetical protein
MSRAKHPRRRSSRQRQQRPRYHIMIHCQCGDGFAIESILQSIEALEEQQALRGAIAWRISSARASRPAPPQMDSSV